MMYYLAAAAADESNKQYWSWLDPYWQYIIPIGSIAAIVALFGLRARIARDRKRWATHWQYSQLVAEHNRQAALLGHRPYAPGQGTEWSSADPLWGMAEARARDEVRRELAVRRGPSYLGRI